MPRRDAAHGPTSRDKHILRRLGAGALAAPDPSPAETQSVSCGVDPA
jgi:hypothetical protein